MVVDVYKGLDEVLNENGWEKDDEKDVWEWTDLRSVGKLYKKCIYSVSEILGYGGVWLRN